MLRKFTVADVVLILVPMLLFGWQLYLADFRGPNWIMARQDTTYMYLFKGLNVLQGTPIGSLNHPGIVITYLHAGLAYFIHFFYGDGDLYQDALVNAEEYSRIIGVVLSLTTNFLIIFLGRAIYRSTGSLPVSILAQAAILILSPGIQIMNANPGAEAFLVPLAVLLTAMTVNFAARDQKDERLCLKYAAGVSVVCGAVLATKFTAAPFLILPVLVIPTLRYKVFFLVFLGISGLVFFAPVYLDWRNLLLFVNGMISNFEQVAREQQARSGQQHILGYFINLRVLARAVPEYFALLIANIAACLAYFVSLRKKADDKNLGDFRLAWILTVVAGVGFLLVAMRPSGHYLGTYVYFLVGATGFIAIALVDGFFQTIRARQIVGWGLMLAFVFTLSDTIPNKWKGELASYKNLKEDSFYIQELIQTKYPKYAITSAIQSSNFVTALEHAYGNSEHSSEKRLSKIYPGNWFIYLLTGKSFLDRFRNEWFLKDIMNSYAGILYWSVHSNFRANGWRRPPDAIMKTIFVGTYETLAEILAFGIPSVFPPNSQLAEKSQGLSGSQGWSTDGCGKACATYSFGPREERPLHSYKLTAIEENSAKNMPIAWTVEGTKDGSSWTMLEKRTDKKLWKVGEARLYELPKHGDFRSFRFRSVSGKSDRWPSSIKLYAKRSLRIRQKLVFGNFQIHQPPGEPLLKERSWEERKPFSPLEIKLAGKVEFDRYLLGTDNEGVGGLDSTGRMPKSWRFLGSNDNEKWTLIDQRKDEKSWKPYEKRFYRIEKPAPYKQYRLIVDESNSPAGIARLYHWRGLEKEPKIRKKTNTPPGQYVFSYVNFWEQTGPGPYPETLVAEIDKSQKLNAYQLSTGNHGEDSINRMIKDWEIHGSDDLKNWQLVDRRLGETNWRLSEHRTFRFESNPSFKYYRMKVLQSNTQGIMRLYGWKFLAYETTEN